MPGQEVRVHDRLVLQPALGLVRMTHDGKVLLDQATAGVTYVGANGQRKVLELAGRRMSYGLARDSVSLNVADRDVELMWQWELGEQTHVRLEVKNIGSRPLHVEELCVLDVASRHGGKLGFSAPPRRWRFYQNGWQSWSPAFSRHVGNGMWVNPNTADYRTKHQPHALSEPPHTLSSEWFTVLTSGDKKHATLPVLLDPALLLGFVTTKDQLAEIRLQVRDDFESLCATSYADGWLLSPGEKLSSETLLLAADRDPMALLDLYAMHLGELMHARVPPTVPTGWCTWYYFFGEDTADDVLANVATAQKEQLPLDVILIDDGYETTIGDWLDVDSSKYPQGMKSVAQQIAAADHRPGIWTAPFGLSSASKLYASHPDWILRDDKSEPVLAWQHWGVDIYALDLSLPVVQAWLQDVFHTLSQDWGFEFFKVDFLFCAALPGARGDPHMTRAQALRRGLEIIRAAIGDRFLLGCGAPLGPCVGIVDGMRIGTDVNVDWRPFWQDLSAPATANAVLNSVARSFMHGKLWLNDPDCLLLRPRGHESNLVLNEMRLLTTVVGLTGGLVLDSDNLPSIRHGRLEYLRRVLPPYGRAAIPVDLFERERPQQFMLPVTTPWGSWTLVALLNWDDHSCTTKLSLSALGLPSRSYHVYNYWRQRYMGMLRDEVTIDPHQPHEAVLLLLKPVSDEPHLLTSTFHVTQGAVEVRDVRQLPDRLVVEMQKAGRQFGQLLFAVPAGVPVISALVNGQPQKPRQLPQTAEVPEQTPQFGIWRVGFSLNDKASVELLFR